MGAFWGSLSALAIGTSELFGRRVVGASSAITAAVVIQVFAAVSALMSIVLFASEFAVTDMAWGALSGLGIATGTACYFGALDRSSSAVVAPTSATVTAVIPFVYTLIRGAEISTYAMLGAVLAFVGVAVLAGGAGDRRRIRAGLTWGLASGAGYGFGISMLVEVSDAAGVWPAVAQRVVAALVLGAVARGTKSLLWPPKGARVSGLATGAFAGIASVFVLTGLAIDEVPTLLTQSMFPIVSVLVGFFVFGDAVARRQVVGIALALCGIAAVVAT